MSRIGLSSGYSVIPEGEYVFGIYDVDYDEEFGRMEVKMVTAKGMKHVERFMLKGNNDEVNEGAMNAFSYFAKVALNDFSVEDIDHTDLIGHYIRATIVHNRLPNRTDPTKTVIFANLGRDKSPADGFEETPSKAAMELMRIGAQPTESSYDLDQLLG